MTVRVDVRGSPAIHKGKGTLRGARIVAVGPGTGRPRAGTMTYGAAHAGTAAMADAEGSRISVAEVFLCQLSSAFRNLGRH